MTDAVFFQPDGAWVGDVIPYAEDGAIHLFYLHEVRTDPKPGMPWHRLRVRDDLVAVDDLGPAFPSGGPDADDFNVYTGSIVRGDDGVHHMFYTGQNPELRGDDGLPLQLVMHATSDDDMVTWQRHPEHTFGATPGYATADWRDPYVFRDDDAGLWRMLIAARHADGPQRRRGTIAQCTSSDLATWEPAEPFWDPRRYLAHECPEVFQWGDWFYLVYSEFSEAFTTRYRMARSLHGPWQVPEFDTLDGRAYYAAKSAALGDRRFFFGWISSREGDVDDGAWQWAGTLSILEATQRPDGTLAFHPTPELLASFTDAVDPGLPAVRLDAPDGYAAAISTAELPSTCRISATLTVDDATTEAGILLRASPDGDLGYAIRLEPRRGRMVLDRWPRRQTGTEQWQISGDVPYVVELERPCSIAPGRHTLEILLDDTLCVATLDGATVLSTRLYDRPPGRLGVFVGEGAASLDHLAVTTRPRPTRRPTPDTQSSSPSKEM